MNERLKYLKKTPVIAVQIDLDTNGLEYRKWGAAQRAKRGDWLVKNGDDTYTVEEESFARTYKQKSGSTGGEYFKTAPVWAEVATEAGAVKTKEGETHYEAGDFLVSNEESGADAYCISAEQFRAMYELAE